LFVEFVIVSISPVPKLEPGPVSYFQLAEDTGDPAAPEKLSLKTVVQPAGGPGTVVAATGWLSATAAPTDADNAAKTAAKAAISRRL
jgi:hypothetical protein